MAKFENLSLGSRNQSLSSMMTGGEFSSDIPLHIQIKEMADEAGVTEVVQLEELDHEFDHVDIERVKEKLIKKNQLISEIILEI
jgi:hypothetical protein